MRRLLLAVVVTIGCSEPTELPELTLSSITPGRAEVGTGPSVTIVGDGFRVALTSDLDDGTPDQPGFAATIGGQPLTDPTLVSEAELTGQAPSTLAEGTYDLVVTMADGRSATLPEAFRVFPAGCSDSCDTCGPGVCCFETCNGSCQTCNSDCACDYTCDGVASCDATCSANSECELTANDTDDASLSCASGAVCSLDCASVANSCTMSCASDAQCLIRCNGTASCDLGCSGGSAMSCPDDVIVCHRDCP